jgi:hypothetical protein
MSRSSRENIERLKSLVTELSSRDAQLKSDIQLFEEFFDTFPLPVTIWCISPSGVILSKRGNGFVCETATNLEDLFTCPKIKELSIPQHQKALKGEKIDYFVQTEDYLFFVKLLPRYDESNSICGVTGISWDVSTNMTMLTCLEDIYEQTTGRRGEYKRIHASSARALNASRLKKMLAQSKE